MGTLMFFHQNQEITAIENVDRKVLDSLKQNNENHSVVITMNEKPYFLNNVLHVQFHEDVNWDFGY